MVAPGTASAAANTNCQASALSVSLLGADPIEPVTFGGDGCPNGSGTPHIALPPIIDADVLIAKTSHSSDSAGPTEQAIGGLTDAKVLSLGSVIPAAQLDSLLDPVVNGVLGKVPPLSINLTTLGTDQLLSLLNGLGLPTSTLEGALGPLLHALPTSTIISLLGLPNTITLDLHGAVQQLVESLLNNNLLSADAIKATVNGSCSKSGQQFDGSSTVTGLKVLGGKVPVNIDNPLKHNVNLVDTANLDLSKVDISKIDVDLTVLGIPLHVSTLTSAVQNLIQPLLNGLPTINVPADLLRVKLSLDNEVTAAHGLRINALQALVSLATKDVLDLTVGTAQVKAAGACGAGPNTGPNGNSKNTPPPANSGPVAQQILACSNQKLRLLDVFIKRHHVRLRGVATQKFVGKRVAIRSTYNGKIVARPKVRRNGSFSAWAKLPPRRIRGTNRARYRAVRGHQHSLALKLTRRMHATAHAKGRKVTLRGKITRPFLHPMPKIALREASPCGKWHVVKRFRPHANGRFKITVRAPKGQSTQVYRFVTKVQNQFAKHRLVEKTFTLPIGVNFAAPKSHKSAAHSKRHKR